jgi:ATP-dependent DNA ligase
MRLAKVVTAFDDRDWIFEIKHDGYRCVAYVGDSACGLDPIRWTV